MRSTRLVAIDSSSLWTTADAFGLDTIRATGSLDPVRYSVEAVTTDGLQRGMGEAIALRSSIAANWTGCRLLGLQQHSRSAQCTQHTPTKTILVRRGTFVNPVTGARGTEGRAGC